MERRFPTFNADQLPQMEGREGDGGTLPSTLAAFNAYYWVDFKVANQTPTWFGSAPPVTHDVLVGSIICTAKISSYISIVHGLVHTYGWFFYMCLLVLLTVGT